MNYDLTVGIVTYNTEEDVLMKVLECLLKVKLNIKIFISDNSEKRTAEETVKKIKDSRVEYIFNNSNRGFGAGHNVIIDRILKGEVNSRYHLAVNADIYFDGGTVERIADYMDLNPEIGQIGPKIKGPDGELSYSCKLIPTPLNLIFRRFLPIRSITDKMDYDYEMKWYSHERAMEVPLLSGCFIFTRSEVFSKIGKFDERYFMYMEDYDLCRRIGKEYKIVYYPEAEIVHEHGKASYKSVKMLFIHMKSSIKYFNKWGWLIDRERTEINKKTKRNMKYDV